VLTLVLYMLSTRLVRPARRWKITLKEALLALAVLAVVGGLSAAAFLTTSSRYEDSSLFAVATRPRSWQCRE